MNATGPALVEGTFEAYSIDDVLGVVSMSRQVLEVVFDEGAARLVVQSGQLLRADLRPNVTGRAAFSRLYRRPGSRFRVIRHPALPGVSPIGTLTELIREARSPSAERVVLEGDFAQHSLDDVLDVIATSRSTLRLQLSRADGTEGTILVKAGRILVCEDPGRGRVGMGAFRSLYAEPGERFSVHLVEGSVGDLEPLGTLDGMRKPVLVAVPQEPATQADPPDVILDGSFADFALSEVLDVVSITRQQVELVLLDHERPRGRVLVKSGVVLSAEVTSPSLTGRAAFLDLMARPGTGFRVVRRPGRSELGAPIGSLATLVAEARRNHTVPDDFDEPPTVVFGAETQADELEPEADLAEVSQQILSQREVSRQEVSRPEVSRPEVSQQVLSQREVSQQLPEPVDDRLTTALELLHRIERRLDAQDRAIASLGRGDPRWLLAAALLAQGLTGATVLLTLLVVWLG